MRTSTARKLALALLAAAGWLSVAAGPAGAQQVEFELGHSQQVVAGAWNPVRLVLRDQRDVLLEIRLDQGSLQTGERVVTYRAPLAGGSGLSSFEDDLFVPAWRSLTWTVRAGGRTLASGALNPRERDGRPLDLVVSRTPGRWRSSLGPEARVLEVDAGALPHRAAAYDGVRSLLIDGTAAAPDPRGVLAAAAAGAVVVLLGPLPASHAELEGLIAGPGARLGAGWITRDDGSDLAGLLARLAPPPEDELLATLAAAALPHPPRPLPALTLVTAAAAYSLLVIALTRFAGAGGLAAGLVLALVASLVGWRQLRPPAPEIAVRQVLTLGGSGLAQAIETRSLLSLPASRLDLPAQMRPVAAAGYEVTPTGTAFMLGRWQTVTLLGKPQLAPAQLEWRGERLANAGSTALLDVYVSGLGPQGSLAAGSSLVPVPAEEGGLPPPYPAIVPLLPTGSALARAGDAVHVALPPAPARGGS